MALLPGGTLGILGGGQLGRMTAMAARELGYRIHALDPDPSCAARFVVEQCITAPFDDALAAAWLAHHVGVVTIEIESIAEASLRAAEQHAPVRPGPEVLAMVQDRVRQKRWLADRGFPVGPFRVAQSEAEVREGLSSLGGCCFVKAARGGYDGRGQFEAEGEEDAPAAWSSTGGQACVIERALALEAELSVLVARSPSGEVAVHPPALNHHEKRILAWSVLPAPMPPRLLARAEEIARELAMAANVEGLLVIELFLVGGELLVNELAPRPHNSFHTSAVGCVTSQFEQHVRAVCDLPLGSTRILRPSAIVNLLGDLWADDGTAPAFDRVLAASDVRLHLYGKRVARPGRKMGHLSATGDSPEDAIARVRAAFASLGSSAGAGANRAAKGGEARGAG